LPEKLPLRKINENKSRDAAASRIPERPTAMRQTRSQHRDIRAQILAKAAKNQNRGTCMSPAQCSVSENDDTAKSARRDFVGSSRIHNEQI
jgi:hypothetical protein